MNTKRVRAWCLKPTQKNFDEYISNIINKKTNRSSCFLGEPNTDRRFSLGGGGSEEKSLHVRFTVAVRHGTEPDPKTNVHFKLKSESGGAK